MIAQYAEEANFLIDGVASPGNSGSPVIIIKEGKIAGMITAYMADHIKMFNEQGVLMATLPYNSGLGRAVSGEILARAINRYFEDIDDKKSNKGTQTLMDHTSGKE